MNRRQNQSALATALQVSLSIILVSISAILLATSFVAAPRQIGEAGPTPAPAPETVALPVTSFDVSVPISTVVLQPVTTTNITAAEMYLGFQGDFTFDSTVINFAAPVVVGGGLTESGWNVSGNVLNTGPGTMKTLRVSAFVEDGQTPLSGEGTLYILRMVRVSNNVGASTLLNWKPDPDSFLFINKNLDTVRPTQTNGTITIGGMTPTPTPASSATPPFEGGTLLWEGFDTANAPALPSGWQSVFTVGAADCTPSGTCGLGTNWVTTPANPYSGSLSAFHDAPGCVTDSVLDTRQFSVPFINTIDTLAVSFRQTYNLESGRDGGVLEISIDGGPFIDIVAAGGHITYSGTISNAFLSPIGGRQAFTGNSGGYIWTFAGLPHSAIGRSVVLRFRLATDCSGSGVGWFIDEVFAFYHFNGTPFPSPTPTPPLSPTISPTPTPTSSPLVSPCPGCGNTPTPTPTPLPFCVETTFSNSGTITIPASGSSGTASTYPSTISASGLGSSIARLSVRFHGFTHSHPKDVDMLLVGPQGQNAIIMSDAGGYGPVAGLDFQITHTFFPVPNGGPMFGDMFGAANWADCDDAGDVFPVPAPVPSGGSALGVFDGTNPNGTWSLYVVDDKDENVGAISGGWDVIIITAPCAFPSATPFPPPYYLEVEVPSSVSPGVPFSFRVLPMGGGSQIQPYPRPIHFSSSDPSAVLPADATPAPVGGTPVPFTATLNQVATKQTITATGVLDPFITGTSICILVQPTPTPTPTESPTPKASPTPTVPKDPGGTPTPIPIPAHALNLSTRLYVSTGAEVGIGGFIVTAGLPVQVLIRGIGPSLGGTGVSNTLADPVLELHGPAGFTTLINNNWRDTQEAEITATGIPPPNDLESAILVTLDPGAYTAILKGNNDGIGVGLVEIYDLSRWVLDSKLGNLSTRAFAGTGSDIVISGFILGDGLSSDLVLLRGLGPSLNESGVTNGLMDPVLELRNSQGAIVAMNDNWQTGPPPSLPPADPLESAIEMALSPGPYTVLLSGANNGTGVGLVEVYDRGIP